MELSMDNYPEGLLAYTVSVGGISQRIILGDIIDSPPGTVSTATLHTLSSSGLFSKITTKAGTDMQVSGGKFVSVLFDNSGSHDFNGLNIEIEYIFKSVASTYTATAVQTTGGTVSATDLDFDRWSLVASPELGYDVNYWEYSTDGDKWTKDESSIGEWSIIRTLLESRQYRAIFDSYDAAIPTNPTHAAILQNLGNLETAVLEVGEHKYTIKREKRDIFLIAYEGPGGELDIPKGITEIGIRDASIAAKDIKSLFNVNITSAVVPEGVSTINNAAFYSCASLAAISLPSTLTTICDLAFQNAGLTEIELPEHLNRIGMQAFAATKLVRIDIPLAMADNGTFGSNIFNSCNELEEIIFPENTTMQVLPSFGAGSKLTSFTIPESVVNISNNAFSGRSIEHIVIPKNVRRIGDSAFRGAKLKSIEFLCPSLDSIENNAFDGCTNLKEIAFPPTVTTMGTQILLGCTNLETVTMPEVTGNITANMFNTCNKLNTLIIPTVSETATLANSAFSGSFGTNAQGTTNYTSMDQLTVYTRSGSRVTNLFKDKTNGMQKVNIKYLDGMPQVTAQNGNDLTFADAGLVTDWHLAGKYDYSLTVPRAEGINATDVTALDALFAAHEAYYGKDTFNPSTYTSYLRVEEGYVMRAFGTVNEGAYRGFVNGMEVEDLAATVVTDKDTVHFANGGSKDDTISHYSFKRNDGVSVHDITMMPDTPYTLTVAADGSGSPVADAAVYAAFHPAGKDVSVFESVGTTGSDGNITLNFTDDDIGEHIVYAKKVGYAFAPLRVTVQGADARLGSIEAAPNKPFEKLTTLKSGYDAGTLVKAGQDGEDIEEGFNPDHYTYNYYVNVNTESLDFGVTANYADSARFMTIAAFVGGEPLAGFTAATSGAWSAIPVTLAAVDDAKTPVRLDITYTEASQIYTQSYTVNVVKSENAAHSWFLDVAPIGKTWYMGDFDYSKAPSWTNLIAYSKDETAAVTVKVSAGNTLKIDDDVQTPNKTNQRFGAFLVDEYDISFDVPDLTGHNPNNLLVAQYPVTVDTGEDHSTNNFYIYFRSLRDGVFTPDRITEYRPGESQFIPKDYVGTPQGGSQMLLSDTHYLRTVCFIGGFGGYVTAEYDDPITNNPNNPYGVDFIVYGNAFEGGKASEPASVEVSSNGTDWYYLAGSHHYELNTSFDNEVTFPGGYTAKTMKYDVQGRAGYPNVTFGYGDVSSCSDQETNPYAGNIWGVTGEPYNPYNGDLKNNIGDGFDLSWVVDKNGKPV
jgi:hypothetical protein